MLRFKTLQSVLQPGKNGMESLSDERFVRTEDV